MDVVAGAGAALGVAAAGLTDCKATAPGTSAASATTLGAALTRFGDRDAAGTVSTLMGGAATIGKPFAVAFRAG